MKLYANLVQAIAEALEKIFIRNFYADQVIPSLLRSNPKWGSRDRKLIAQTCYDLVRWLRTFMFLAEVDFPLDKKKIHQLILAYAIRNEIPIQGNFSEIDKDTIRDRAQSLPSDPAIVLSLPDWLLDVCVKALGKERCISEFKALNNLAPVVLRANTLKTDRNGVQKYLAFEKIETTLAEGFPQALILKNRSKVTHTKPYKKGLFEIQDAASQLVAPALAPEPGEFIIDACAGAGGKTLHLAALMENRGKIVAFDIHKEKLKELMERAVRNGVTIVDPKLISKGTDLTEYSGKADRVLIDAPCSGLGVLRRNPDTKWKLRPEELSRLTELQANILAMYSSMVKSGGTLVYATCSILPQENTEQLHSFLKSDAGSEFVLTKEETIWPSEHGFDGFYIATMNRK